MRGIDILKNIRRRSPGMKRLMVLAAGIVFVFSAAVFAVDGPSQVPAKTDPSKAGIVKPPTKVSITGVVKDISDTMISVQRTVRGNTEIMEFALDKAVEKIKVGEGELPEERRQEYSHQSYTRCCKKNNKKTFPIEGNKAVAR
jgi:hypothetical protein